jgi:hypothetical protein
MQPLPAPKDRRPPIIDRSPSDSIRIDTHSVPDQSPGCHRSIDSPRESRRPRDQAENVEILFYLLTTSTELRHHEVFP